MNHGPIVFLVAFLALAGSWFGMVLVPQTQIGQLQPTNTVPATAQYPLGPAGMAQQGLQVYRAQGCAYCHSQQVRQNGTVCEVMLNEIGTNQPTLITALAKIKGTSEDQARELLKGLPAEVTRGARRPDAEAQVRALRAAGAKSDLWVDPIGPDIARGFGRRRTVAEDFLYHSPVMPGSIRIGPDLSNVGARNPDPMWHLRHLYAPSLEVTNSPMPPYRYLFEKRKIAHLASANALPLPAEAKVPDGYEIVPKAEARALVAYLTSLRVDAPLYQAPLSVPALPPPPATNAPAGDTNAPAGATNSAAGGTNASAAPAQPPATNSSATTNSAK